MTKYSNIKIVKNLFIGSAIAGLLTTGAFAVNISTLGTAGIQSALSQRVKDCFDQNKNRILCDNILLLVADEENLTSNLSGTALDNVTNAIAKTHFTLGSEYSQEFVNETKNASSAEKLEVAIDILLMQKADEYLEKDFTLYFPPKFSDNDASKCMTVFAETFGNKTCKEPVSIELEKGIKISDATLIKMLKLFGNLQTLKIPYGYLTDGLVDLLGTYKGLQSIWLTGVGGGGLPSDVGQRLNKLHGMNDQIKIYFE